MADYSRQIATAQRQFAKYGELCSYFAGTIDTSADPTQPWNAVDGVQIDPAPTVFILWNYPAFRTQRPGQRDVAIDATEGIQVGYMAVQPFVPLINDCITRTDGSRWIVDSFDIVNPGGVTIMYEMAFKK